MISHALVYGLAYVQARGDYSDMRQAGHTPGVSMAYAIGSAAVWTYSPGLMTGMQAAGMVVPLMQAAHQKGTQRWTAARTASMPYATQYRFNDTELAQQRRYSAVGDLNRTYNIARNQAKRMRG